MSESEDTYTKVLAVLKGHRESYDVDYNFHAGCKCRERLWEDDDPQVVDDDWNDTVTSSSPGAIERYRQHIARLIADRLERP